MPSPASTSWRSRPPAPARRWRSRCRSSTGCRPTTPRPSALVLVPTRELAVQVTAEFASIAAARGLSVATVYGGVSTRTQAKAAKAAHMLVATPGRLTDIVPAADDQPGQGLDPRPRRGRPDARHGLQAAGRPDHALAAGRAPDDVLLGHAGRRGRRAGPRLHRRTPAATRPSRRPRRWSRSTTGSSRSRDDDKLDTLIDLLQGRRRPRRWSSSAPSAAPTRLAQKLDRRGRAGSRDARRHDAERSASRRWERFETGKVSTLVATDVAARGLDLDGSRTSSTTTRPRTTRATSTASAAPAVPAAAAPASRW